MFSALKKMLSGNETTTEPEDVNTSEGTNIPKEETDNEPETSSSSSKKLICQGAKCSCNQSETPTKIDLKIISQSKFYINDAGGSTKLIASTMEIGQPFDAPFFGKCKLQPSGSSFLPCQPAITAWQKPYENVELSNGGKILTEESTAMCGIGGTVKIEKHGQDPAQINESQVQNGTLAVTTLLNPMLDEADIEILAGGTSDGDENDDTGAAVKKISTTDGKKKYLKKQWIQFKVDTWYKNSATNKDKVNWIVYDTDEQIIQEHIDIGEVFDTHFSKDGVYTIEAYGGSSGGPKAAKYQITIKEPDLNTITKNVQEKIRANESATFSLTVDMPDAIDITTLEEIQWAVYKSTNRGKTYTETVENAILGKSYTETAIFAEEGYFQIKATYKEKEVASKLRVGKNGVTSIKFDKGSMRVNNDLIKFSVPTTAYSIKPPTEEETHSIKWIVYDHNFTEVTELSGITGASFEFSNHANEGVYYVEAYMNSSEIGRIKKGKSSNCIKKVIVTTPEVTLFKWTDQEGRYKQSCGFDEDMYVYAHLNAFNGQKVKLHFYNVQTDNSKTLIAKTQAITVSNKGEATYKIKFPEATYKSKLKNGKQTGTGYVVYEVLPFDEKETIKKGKAGLSFTHGMKLNIKNKASVCGVFFEKDGKRLRNLRFDDTMTCHIKTYNLVGKDVKIRLHRYDEALWLDNLNPDDKINTYTAAIDSQGRASFDICIEKKWNGLVGTREKFYLELDDVQWYSKAQKSQAIFIAYTKKDKLENQVNPVVVEQASGTTKKKNGQCENCDKDITLDDIKSIYSEVNETGLQAAVDFLNSQRSFFGLTTCTRKAHFLAQLAAESGFTDMEESFKYKYKSLRSVGLVNFNSANDPNRTRAKEWGYGFDGRTKSQITKADERSIANWAYGKLPKASGLGNTPIRSNWSDENADGWNYRGSGFIQLTGKSNFRSVSNLYNSWIATDNSGLDKVDLVANPDELRTDKSKAIAAALIYWKNNNLLTRSDMGVGTDALGAITYKINTKFAGWAHRESYLEKAVETLKVEDCEDYVRRKSEKGSVVVISGEVHDMFAYTENRIYARYKTSVYRSMTLKTYEELKEKENIPEPDYITYLSRDAFDETKDGNPVLHSELRYGSNNECPPNDNYYLNSKADSSEPDSGTYKMYISENNNNRDINGSDGFRDGIAIHQYTPKDSQGCLTTVTGQDRSKVEELYNEIPDLFIHNYMNNVEREDDSGVKHSMKIERRYVRIILEERKVEIKIWGNSSNGTNKFVGVE